MRPAGIDVKFTNAGRIDFAVELRRQAEVGGDAVLVDITIADTGIGIPPRSNLLSARRSTRLTAAAIEPNRWS